MLLSLFSVLWCWCVLLYVLLVSALLFSCFTRSLTTVGDRAIAEKRHGQHAGAATQTQSLLTAVDVVASVDDSTTSSGLLSYCFALYYQWSEDWLPMVRGLTLARIAADVASAGQKLKHNHSRMCCCCCWCCSCCCCCDAAVCFKSQVERGMPWMFGKIPLGLPPL